MSRSVQTALMALAVVIAGSAGCNKAGGTDRRNDEPMPVGTRTHGEGPNPDVKDESPTPPRRNPSSDTVRDAPSTLQLEGPKEPKAATEHGKAGEAGR